MFIYNSFNYTANNPKPDLKVFYRQQCSMPWAELQSQTSSYLLMKNSDYSIHSLLQNASNGRGAKH